nr:hypothetical protein [Streptomyces sudanensis]
MPGGARGGGESAQSGPLAVQVDVGAGEEVQEGGVGRHEAVDEAVRVDREGVAPRGSGPDALDQDVVLVGVAPPAGHPADVDDEVEAVGVQVDGAAVPRGAYAMRVQLAQTAAEDAGRGDHEGVGGVLATGEDDGSVPCQERTGLPLPLAGHPAGHDAREHGGTGRLDGGLDGGLDGWLDGWLDGGAG